MTRWRAADPARLAGLFVVWAVAWSVTPGRIAADTKNDLYVDPWGFLASALHAWDPQVTWGGLQNQAYGYLFPMGPFFGVGSELMPMWVVQRLWWTTLLTVGYVAVLGLLRALDVGTPRVRIVASLAYVLAPRVLSTIGGLSSEAHPQLFAPAILWPLVLVDRGLLGARKGAALSGLAILCCGGVNATATAFAILPSAIWLLTRRSWWKRPVTWTWGLMVLAATSWWVVPLLLLGRYSPPFLDWIENAQTVSAQITLLDILRGTTPWLAHLVTSSGEWWPAGYQLVSSRTSIILTTTVMTLGLAAFALRRLPQRGFLLACLALGVLIISLPHQGPFGSPFTEHAQAALDGTLAPLRNIHKADLLVRLPLAVGLAHLLGVVASWRPRRDWWGGAVLVTVTLVVVGAAAPGFSGAISPRGAFVEMAPQWRQLGRWLDGRTDGRALIVPASNFGEYVWGRPMDEPLRPLTSAAYAVRDAVPLAPAGAIRLLDEVERRLQTGTSISGATAMLRSSGVKYLVLRNDLAAAEAGQPPVALARSAIVNTPDTSFIKGFGKTWLDATGDRVFPIEVYALDGDVTPDLAMWRADQVIGAAGAAEDLARLEDAGLGGRPVIFDGDQTEHLTPDFRVVTDGFRARTRWFGAPRGQDVTNTLDRPSAVDAPDYLPWPGVDWRSLVSYSGIRGVHASTSIAEDFGVVGLQPAHRPFAALDGDSRTSWATSFATAPELTIDLEESTDLREIALLPFADRVRFGRALGIPTEVAVSTDQGVVHAELANSGRATPVALPDGSTGTVSVRILDTTGGDPSRVVTGLAEVSIPGVTPVEVVSTPTAETGPQASAAVLDAGLPGRDGCSLLSRWFTCFSGLLVDPEAVGPMVRDVVGLAPGVRTMSGTLAVDPLRLPEELVTVPGVNVTTSSVRGYAPQQLPVGVIDTDPRTAWSPSPDDESPSVTITLDEATSIQGIRVQARRDWAERASPAVVVDVDGNEVTRRLPAHGVLTIPPITGRRITLTFVSVPGKGRPGIGSLELEEVEIVGHPFALPAQELEAGCGSGPRVTVDGRTVSTSLKGPRAALFGLGEFTWKACEPVTFGDAALHRISVDQWHHLAPGTVVVAPEVTRGEAAPLTVPFERVGPTLVRAVVAAGPKGVVVMADNANEGWEARIGGTRLEPQVVDGRRQGFVVPAGLAGRLTIEFAPDQSYRLGLLLGGLLAGLVVVLALLPQGVRKVTRRVPAAGRRGRRLMLWTTPVWCGVVAGPAGIAVGALTMLATWRLPRRMRLGAVLLLGLAAALVQAWLAPGWLGGSGVEGTVRLLTLGAFALALASQESPDES